MKEVTYKSGSLALKAWLTEDPRDGSRHPAVVFVHGGFAFGADDLDDAFPYFKQGFVVMTPMLRGENGNLGSFEWFFGEVDDVIAAARHLATISYVNPRKIYVAGHSSGATLALLSALVTNTPFAAAAPVGAYVNNRVFLAVDGWRKRMPFDPANTEEVRLRDADQFTSSLQVPVRLYVGKSDKGAQLGSDAFVKNAKALGKACEKIEIVGDHGDSKDEALRASAAWFVELSKSSR